MEFYLKASLKTSADPAIGKEDIEKIMTEAKDTILAKGAPAGEGAQIKSWAIGDKSIDIELTSGRYVRVHDAILRLKKALAEPLGKNHKIGIRGLDAEMFTISVPAEHDLKNKKFLRLLGGFQ